jgi:hypothetical protein
MDMPVPSVAEWEWLNWKFPRPVKAGETIYARWTLTQKRPPVGGAPTAIVVWRVDVHTNDGALCAEGDVGASVRRNTQAARPRTAEATAAGPAPTPAPPSRRRRGRRPAASTAAAASPPPPLEAPATVATAPSGSTEKTGAARRRRRRRPRASSAPGRDGQAPTPAPAAEISTPAPAPVAASPAGSAPPAGRLSRVIKRLRRP